MDRRFSRRKFIHKFIISGTLFVGGASFLNSCNSKKSGEKKAENGNVNARADVESCDDLSGVSAGELEKRNRLAYVEKSPMSDSRCDNCSLYLPPSEKSECGGCMLFEGPVFAEAYCTYWAPVE